MAQVLFVDIFGWIGSVAVILAYALISLNKITAMSWVYQVLNLVGSVCLIVNTAFYHAYPSTFVNVVWLLIAFSALIRIMRTVHRRAPS